MLSFGAAKYNQMKIWHTCINDHVHFRYMYSVHVELLSFWLSPINKTVPCHKHLGRCCGLMVSALDSSLGSSPGQFIVLCSLARHLTLTVPLSTQEYKWVLVNCQDNLLVDKMLGTCNALASHPGE